jgi:hypothetical protein
MKMRSTRAASAIVRKRASPLSLKRLDPTVNKHWLQKPAGTHLYGAYIETPRFTWILNGIESTFDQQRFSGSAMTSLPDDSEPDNAWRWARRYLQCMRGDWPANGDNPYSPLVCFSVLLALGLILELGH